MGRSPCCAKEGLNRGAWTPMEDRILTDYIKSEGEGKWRSLPQRAGLRRCGKSCRLRWLNYLRPDIKRGNISSEEEDLIIRLHKLLGNRWSLIAGRLPGRTDNEVKNYWNTNLGKKILQGTQAAASTKCKPSSSTRSRSLAVKNLRREEPICPAPNGSCVVRTKARRCTKVFTDADLQATAICSSSAKFRHGAMKAPPPSVADAKSDLINVALTDDDKSAELEPPSGVALLTVSPTFCGAGGEAQYSELLMDLEIDNKFLSDLLSTDFAGLEHDFDKGEAQGDIHTNEANDFIDPNSSHGAVLHDDHDSDLGSMAALLDYPAMDWLIVD